MRSRVLSLISAILVLVTCGGLFGAPVEPVTQKQAADGVIRFNVGSVAPIKPAVSPPYTESQAQQYLKEVLPVVEKVTGKKLANVPGIEIEKDRLNGKPRTFILGVVDPGLGIPSLSDAYAQGVSSAIDTLYIAQYQAQKNIIAMQPRHFIPRMKSAGIEPKDYPSVLKLIIAHELTHAVQRQEMETGHRTSTGGLSVASPILEGHAKLVESLVAKDLGISALDRRMSERLPKRIEDVAKSSPNIYRAVGAWIVGEWYMQGFQFMEWQYMHGGMERLWKILSSPPQSASVLYTPQKFDLDHEQASPYAAILTGLEERLGNLANAKWKVQNYELDQLTLRGYIRVALPSEFGAITNGVVYIRSLEARDKGRSVAVQVYIVRDSAAQKPTVSFLNRWFGKVCGESTGVTKTPAKLSSKAIESPAHHSVVRTTCPNWPKRAIYTAVGKNKVVAVSLNGWEMTDKQVSSIVDEVMKRAESLENRK